VFIISHLREGVFFQDFREDGEELFPTGETFFFVVVFLLVVVFLTGIRKA
jgi:hypothetical protein